MISLAEAREAYEGAWRATKSMGADAATVLIQAAWVQLKLAMQRDRMQRTVS